MEQEHYGLRSRHVLLLTSKKNQKLNNYLLTRGYKRMLRVIYIKWIVRLYLFFLYFMLFFNVCQIGLEVWMQHKIYSFLALNIHLDRRVRWDLNSWPLVYVTLVLIPCQRINSIKSLSGWLESHNSIVCSIIVTIFSFYIYWYIDEK